MKKIFLILTLIMGVAVQSKAETITYETCGDCQSCGENCKYMTNGSKIYVLGPTQKNSDGSISEGKVSYRAFFECAGKNDCHSTIPETITDLEMSGNITQIGESAFHFSGLKNITLAPSVTTIGWRAIYYNTNLENLVLPSENIDFANGEIFADTKVNSIETSASNLQGFLEHYGELKKDENGKINITCTVGDCEKYLKEESKYKDNTDILNSIRFLPIEVQNKDGSRSVFLNGRFLGFKGKRIYTVEEAEMVTKPSGNRFRIRYH